jgi:hypothetical protein
MVRSDRAENAWFDEYFKKNFQKQKDNNMLDGCDKENEDNHYVQADNDLFDDDDDDNKNSANLDGWNGVSKSI